MAPKFLAILIAGISLVGGTSANEANRQLMASSEENRRAAFRLILVGAGERCGIVMRTYFQGETASGTAVWSVDCGQDGAYNINIAADEGGSTKLISCARLQQLGGSECFKPLAGQR
jgi:hypothetical protein